MKFQPIEKKNYRLPRPESRPRGSSIRRPRGDSFVTRSVELVGGIGAKVGSRKNRGGGRRTAERDGERRFEGRKEGRRQQTASGGKYSSRVECPFSWFLSSSLPGRRKPSPSLLLSPFSSEGREASLGDTFQANSGSRLLASHAWRGAATELANVERIAEELRGNRSGAAGEWKKEEGG